MNKGSAAIEDGSVTPKVPFAFPHRVPHVDPSPPIDAIVRFNTVQVAGHAETSASRTTMEALE